MAAFQSGGPGFTFGNTPQQQQGGTFNNFGTGPTTTAGGQQSGMFRFGGTQEQGGTNLSNNASTGFSFGGGAGISNTSSSNTEVVPSSTEDEIDIGVSSFALDSNSWDKLLGAIASFVDSAETEDIYDLEDEVARNFEDLRQPLRVEERSINDRSQVESAGRSGKVNASQILQLADTLELNEMETWRLWQESDTKQCRERLRELEALPKELMIDHAAVAICLFYYQRACLLSSLCELFRLRYLFLGTESEHGEFSLTKRSFVVESTDGMLSGNGDKKSLPMVLLELAEKLEARIDHFISPHGNSIHHLDLHLKAACEERRKVCECVFLIFSRTSAEEDEAAKILASCNRISWRWMYRPEVVQNRLESSSSLECQYLMLFSLACILDWDHALYDRNDTPRTGKFAVGAKLLSENLEWVKMIDEMLTSCIANKRIGRTIGNTNPSLASAGGPTETSLSFSIDKWTHDGVHGACLFLWGLFLSGMRNMGDPVSEKQHRIDVLKFAFERRAIAFFRGLVRSNEFSRDELRPTLVGIVDDMCTRFLGIADSDSASVIDSDEDGSSEELLRPRAQLVEEEEQRFYHMKQQQQMNISTQQPAYASPYADSRFNIDVGAQAGRMDVAYHLRGSGGGGWGVHNVYGGTNHYNSASAISNRFRSSPYGGSSSYVGTGSTPGGGSLHRMLSMPDSAVVGARTPTGGIQDRMDRVGSPAAPVPRNNANKPEEVERGTIGDSIEDLMSLVAAVCRLQPRAALKYWNLERIDDTLSASSSEEEDMIARQKENLQAAGAFIGKLRPRIEQSNDPTSLYVCFLHFLASLVTGEECAKAAHAFLSDTDPQKIITWSKLFQALKHYDSYSRPVTIMNGTNMGMGMGMGDSTLRNPYGSQNGMQQQQEMSIQDADQFVLASWILLLTTVAQTPSICESVIRHGEDRNQTSVPGSMMFNSASNNPNLQSYPSQDGNTSLIDLLLGLLRQDIRPALKSQVGFALAGLARSPVLATILWDKVERYQVLKTHSGINAIAAISTNMVNTRVGGMGMNPMNQYYIFGLPSHDVRSYLESLESAEHQYSFTMGFLELLRNLIKNGDDNRFLFLGTGSATCPGIFPYLEFALEDVFLRYDQRTYKKPGDQWRLAAYALGIFHEILQSYDLDSGPSQSDFSDNGSVTLNANPNERSFSAGFWVMAQVLQGGAFFKKLVDLIYDAGGAIGVANAREGREFLLGKKRTSALSPQKESTLDISNQQMLFPPTQPVMFQNQPQPMQDGSLFSSPMMQNQHQQQQQQQLLLSSLQHQNRPTGLGGQNASLKKPWYLVTCNRKNVDLRLACLHGSENDSAGAMAKPNGYGLMRIRQRSTGSSRIGDDGGKFAVWLERPFIEGWSAERNRNNSDDPSSSVGSIQDSDEALYRSSYEWDDGDPVGKWREYAVSLSLSIISMVAQREDKFMLAIRSSKTMLEDRVERLHRMLLFRREHLLALASFVRYPYSEKIRVSTIELLFRISAQARHGALVKEFISNMPEIVGGFTWCFENSGIDVQPDSQEYDRSNSDETFPVPSEEASKPRSRRKTTSPVPGTDFEMHTGDQVDDDDTVQTKILDLLLNGLGQPKGNFSQFLLGLRDMVSGVSSLDSLNLEPNVSRHVRTCLHVICDRLDRECENLNGSGKNQVEKMFKLVYMLCQNSATKLGVCLSLRRHRSNFWLRNFEYASRQFQSSAQDANIVAWILKGMNIDLKLCLQGPLQNSTLAKEYLCSIFTARTGLGSNGAGMTDSHLEQTQLRIIQVLDAIPLEGEDDMVTSIIDAPQLLKELVRSTLQTHAQTQPSTTSQRQTKKTKTESRKIFDGSNNVFIMDHIEWKLDDFQKQGKASEQDSIAVWEWALRWNRTQEKLVARSHLVSAWAESVHVALVESREELGRIPQFGANGEKQLAYKIIDTVLQKLVRQTSAPAALSDPLSAVVMTLVWQLRFGDARSPPLLAMEEQVAKASDMITLSRQRNDQDNISTLNAIIAAATGASVSGYCDGNLNMSKGLGRISTEDHHKLLVGILEALQRKARASSGGDRASAQMRKCLYAALSHLLQGSRAQYAEMMQSVVGMAAQIPARVSEQAFLASTASSTLNFSTNTEFNAGSMAIGLANSMTSQSSLENLRNRAASSIEALEVAGRGDALWEMAVLDSVDATDLTTRALALSTINMLFAFDRTGKWLAFARRRGMLHNFVAVVLNRVTAPRLDVPIFHDTHYLLVISVLISVALTRSGALALVESNVISRLHENPIPLLNDKRALEAYAAVQQQDQRRSDESIVPIQERRHNVVLPLLRLILAIFATLSTRSNFGEHSSKLFTQPPNSGAARSSSDTQSFTLAVIKFIRAQRRMITGVLSLPPASLSDLDEITLVVAVLTRCAKNDSALFVRELGDLAMEFDALCFELIREIVTRNSSWTILPQKPDEMERAQQIVGTGPDSNPTLKFHDTLFGLDRHSQGRRLLEHVVAYCRSRSSIKVVMIEEQSRAQRSTDENLSKTVNIFATTNGSGGQPQMVSADVFSLILGIDYAAKALQSLSRSCPDVFWQCLLGKGRWDGNFRASETEREWFKTAKYVKWSTSSLMFVLEGALAILYIKLRAIRSFANSDVKSFLQHECLLPNHFDSKRLKSPLEELESSISQVTQSNHYVRTMIRKLREL